TTGVEREYPPSSGSVAAISSSGHRYACQPRRRAPANRLSAPTGAKFQCWITRTKAPRIIRPTAMGRDTFFSIDFSSTFRLSRLSLRLPGGRPVRFPQSFGRAGDVAGPTAPDKKGVAQPVQVWHRFGRNVLHPAQRDAFPFGAAADRA